MEKVFSLFLAWIGFTNPQHLPPEEYLLSEPHLAQIFPAEIRPQLEKALKTIPWKEDQLTKTPSLAFTSAQSKTAHGNDVLNRVHYFSRNRFDVWVMKQSSTEHPRPAKDWNRVVIAVDKKAIPKKAYYFELASEKASDGALPPLKAFTAACVTCHSSGPRLIRPQHEFTDPLLKNRLQLWNKKIMKDRVVENHLPLWEGESMVEWNRPGDQEVLQWATCKECHAPESGVRNSLSRAQGESILFLTRTGQMPVEHAPLSKKQIDCLKRWIENPKEKQQVAECAEESATTELPKEWVLDPFQSSIQATVATNLNSFSISHFQLSGGIDRSGSTLKGFVQVGLRSLQTGIQLRDEHLKKLILKKEDLGATIEIHREGLFSFGPSPVPLKMNFKGKTKDLLSTLQCKIGREQVHCKGHLTLHLKDWEITAPAFLGARVLDPIETEIDLIFR